MSLEIRTYDGPTDQLCKFIVNCWTESYSEKMVVPAWTPEYFDWQMTDPSFVERDYLVTAWKDNELVGAVLGMPFPLWMEGHEYLGSQASWLSVSRAHRRLGVGSALAQALDQRQRDNNCVARIGYAFQRSRVSQGPRFWKKSQPQTHGVRNVSLWARVLNPAVISRWTNKPLERLLLKSLPKAVCRTGSVRSDVTIRAYQPDDLAVCQQLINDQAKQADLAVLWTAERLGRQLSFGQLAHTLVVERDSTVVGFINYHLLGLTLKSLAQSAIIDLLACQQLTGREVTALLSAMLQQAQQQQADIVLMREFHGQPFAALLKSMFVPQLPESLLMVSQTGGPEDTDLTKLRKIHVLWR